VCSRIPKGKVSTYKEIGKFLGMKGYRAVGLALNKNPFSPTVPCHRVVGSDGSLVGFAGGLDRKTAMLREEGISITTNRIRNFKKFFYSFSKQGRKGEKEWQSK
jgi:methylated-DNA-[protein]-cysteine S-methyltransferase